MPSMLKMRKIDDIVVDKDKLQFKSEINKKELEITMLLNKIGDDSQYS